MRLVGGAGRGSLHGFARRKGEAANKEGGCATKEEAIGRVPARDAGRGVGGDIGSPRPLDTSDRPSQAARVRLAARGDASRPGGIVPHLVTDRCVLAAAPVGEWVGRARVVCLSVCLSLCACFSFLYMCAFYVCMRAHVY